MKYKLKKAGRYYLVDGVPIPEDEYNKTKTKAKKKKAPGKE